MNKKITWKTFISVQKELPYFDSIEQKLCSLESTDVRVYPPLNNIYRAFELTPIENIKVVIIGQDPYHGHGQANGLSFSVNKGYKIPPSLRNIFKELESEYPDFEIPEHGDLTSWATQGVMLLNAVLTVEESTPNAHKDIGWHTFTDNAIRHINDHCSNVVFILWGAFAQKKEALINSSKHAILKSPHPSPFSARKGFFGNNHFKLANEWLDKKGKSKINWNLP